MYSCWYSHCICLCTAVGTVTVYEDLQPVSHINSSSHSSRLSSHCLQHDIFPKSPHLVFPFDVLQVVSHCSEIVFPENNPPHISSATNGRQPTDRPSHTTYIVLSLSTATIYKNAVCRIKISLNNTANVRIT